MILVIRIHGSAEIDAPIGETLKRLHIHRKLATTLINENDKIQMGMLNKVANYVCFNEVDDDIIKQLIIKRGQTINGKPVEANKVEGIIKSIKEGKWEIKKFFRLHPPIGGFRKSTKLLYPKGILGKNKDINKLVLRML